VIVYFLITPVYATEPRGQMYLETNTSDCQLIFFEDFIYLKFSQAMEIGRVTNNIGMYKVQKTPRTPCRI
jgi:hypothetical protein